MRQTLLLSLLILAVAYSLSCPAWSCNSDITQQKNKNDDYHCVEFESGNKVSLYKQSDACKSSDTNCFLVETLEYINEESTGTLSGSSSYCYSDLLDYDDYYFIYGDSLYASFYKKDCESFDEAVQYCEEFEEEEEDYEEDYEEENGEDDFNEYEEEEGNSGWVKCTSDSECQSINGCYCVPNNGTFGRCATSWMDDYLIDLAVVEAACDSQDQETYCVIQQFYDQVSGTLLTSMLENDLDCLDDQTWDLQYYSTVDLAKVMEAYNEVDCEICFSSLLALFSAIMVALL